MSMLTRAGTAVAFPAFSRMLEAPQRLRNAFLKGIRLNAMISMPLFCAISVLAYEVVEVFLGTRWLPSVAVVQWFAIIGILTSVNNLSGSMLMSTGRSSQIFLIEAGNLLTSVLIVLIMMPFGIDGIAAGLCVRSMINLIVLLISVRLVVGYTYLEYMRSVQPALFASTGMVLWMLGMNYALLLSSGEMGRLVIAGISGCLVYYGLLFALSRASCRELTDFALSFFGTRRIKVV